VISKPLSILLADDDKDDRLFFTMALEAVTVPTELVTVADGEKLMTYLIENAAQLPYVLFLDHNMPRKNGSECLAEIKQNPKLKMLPIVIYSTSLRAEIADVFYENGAHYYVKKCDYRQLIKIIGKVLTLLAKDTSQPSRDNFILTAEKGENQHLFSTPLAD
jgi:CheY-like chemotaxis protein